MGSGGLGAGLPPEDEVSVLPNFKQRVQILKGLRPSDQPGQILILRKKEDDAALVLQKLCRRQNVPHRPAGLSVRQKDKMPDLGVIQEKGGQRRKLPRGVHLRVLPQLFRGSLVSLFSDHNVHVVPSFKSL